MDNKTDLINQVEIIIFRKQVDKDNLLDFLFEKYGDDKRVLIIKAITVFMSFSRIAIKKEFPKIIEQLSLHDLTDIENTYLNLFKAIQLFDYSAALGLIKSMVKINPDDVLAVSMLSAIGFYSGQVDKVVESYESLRSHYQ